MPYINKTLKCGNSFQQLLPLNRLKTGISFLVKILYPRPPVLSASGVPTKSSSKNLVRKMPVFRNLRKDLSFRRIQKFGSDFHLIFENPSHFSAIFRLKNVKISLRNFRISLRNLEITLSNSKISLLDFPRVKIFAKITQFCVLF